MSYELRLSEPATMLLCGCRLSRRYPRFNGSHGVPVRQPKGEVVPARLSGTIALINDDPAVMVHFPPLEHRPASRVTTSGRQHQCIGIWTPSTEHAVIGGSATGEQEQRHVDPERPLKQCDHLAGLSQSTGTDGPAQSLARLISQGSKQFVEAVLLQRLRWRHAADLINADQQTLIRAAKCLRYLSESLGLAEMVRQVPQASSHDLHRTSATGLKIFQTSDVSSEQQRHQDRLISGRLSGRLWLPQHELITSRSGSSIRLCIPSLCCPSVNDPKGQGRWLS
ncbi:MAG: hypothetical protein WBN89_11250 [Prochlorococcaceae cyanobacterium]